MFRAAEEGAAQTIAPLMDAALLGLYHGHQEHAWTKNVLDGVEAVLADAGVHSRLQEQPAICFLDITGYTQLTEDLVTRPGRSSPRPSAELSGECRRGSAESRRSGWATG